MMSLKTWAARWNLPDAALRELAGIPGLELVTPSEITTEAGVQSAVRLEASRAGWHLFRNNRGAFKDETGRWIRYGLANDSKTLGDRLKSHDLVGWRTVVITADDVGSRIAKFTSRECKPIGWAYSDTEREQAQLRWHLMVLAAGGDSAFVTGTGSIR